MLFGSIYFQILLIASKGKQTKSIAGETQIASFLLCNKTKMIELMHFVIRLEVWITDATHPSSQDAQFSTSSPQYFQSQTKEVQVFRGSWLERS